jgi:hypothetical protein
LYLKKLKPMTGIITLIVAGTDTGPFDSNADGYSSAFASSVSKLELTNGYPSNDLPGCTTVKNKIYWIMQIL